MHGLVQQDLFALISLNTAALRGTYHVGCGGFFIE